MTVEVVRPLHLGCQTRVFEHGRRCYFVVSLSLATDLRTGRVILDHDVWEPVLNEMEGPPLLDTGMPKPRGEWLVTGSFFAPNGEPTPEGRVRVRVNDRSKELLVFGDREWSGGRATPPAPMTSMPIVYERAFGGPEHADNPVGRGFRDGRLPNIEWPEQRIKSVDDIPLVAGFGPQLPNVPRRQAYAGTYDDHYLRDAFPGYPMDMDWRLFMTAPEDQWLPAFFSGQDRFSVEGMREDGGRFEGRLGGERCRAFVRGATESSTLPFQEVALNMDTLWLFPGADTAVSLWRGVVEVRDDDASELTHLLAAFESADQKPRTLAHYQAALQRRIDSDDRLLNHFRTQDLIPPTATAAISLLQEKGLEDYTEQSAFDRNMVAFADKVKADVEGQVDEATQAAADGRAQLDDAPTIEGVPSKDEFLEQVDRERKQPSSEVQQALNAELERIIPGITGGDPRKIDLSDFSFAKLDEIFAAVDRFMDGTQAQLHEQVTTATQTFDKLDVDAETRQLLNQQLEALDAERRPPSPLPRMNLAQFQSAVDAGAEALEQQRDVLVDKDDNPSMRAEIEQVQEAFDAASQAQVNADAAADFRDLYRDGAHRLEDGASPHERPLAEVRAEFVARWEQGASLAEGDWALLDLSGMNLDGIDLRDAYLEQVDLSAASLVGADLRGAILARANLEGAVLRGAKLDGANVGAVRAEGADFSDASLQGAKLGRGRFAGARFHGADLSDAEWLEVDIAGTDFSAATLPGAYFLNLDLRKTIFKSARAEACIFHQCDLTEAIGDHADLSRSVFNDCRGHGASFRGANLVQGSFVPGEEGSDFAAADFSGAMLERACFRDLDLTEARFIGASLEYAVLQNADLTRADMTQAKAFRAQFGGSRLHKTRMVEADLREALLGKAYLVQADFSAANLYGADFLRARFGETRFYDANLDATLIRDWQPS